MKPNNENINNTCLICGSKKIHYDFSIGKFRVEECVDCKLVRLNPQPSDQELSKIYSENYFIKLDNNQAYISQLKSSTADRYLNLIESYSKNALRGRLLEIGCGQGDFLVKAAARGLDVTGVEYSSHAAEIAANKLGQRGQVICGEVTHLPASAQQSFDYVVFADVLEHVRHPRRFLESVHHLLRQGGMAIVIVPSLDSFSARLMKNKWVEFKLEHLWYFSKKTLKRLLYSENFGAIKVHKARKTLSFDYIAEHFERYPVRPFSNILNGMKYLLPRFLRRYPIRIDAGGIMLLAEKKEIRPLKKLSIVMAAYNEEKTLREIIDRVLEKQIPNVEIELVIVESNSTDNTRAIVKTYEGRDRVKIVLQDKACGKGNAIRTGFEHVTGDIILIQDADDEYDIEDYDVLIEPILSGEAEFVLGARHGGRAWKMRQFTDQKLTGHLLNFGHWFFTLLINVFYGLRLKDPFTMYKVFRTDCLRNLKFECNRFDFDCELLIKLVRSGYKPIEIPVNYRSRSFTEGKKVQVFRDPLTWLRAILKFRLQKI